MTMNGVVAFTAQYLFLVSFILVVYAWLTRNKKKQFEQWLFFVFTILMSGLLGFIAGHLYFHARPFVVTGIAPLFPHVADNSFPSDHALLTAAIAVGLWKTSRRISAIAWIIALFVGAARVMAGVHWPVDIVASMVIAIIGGFASSVIMRHVSQTPKKSVSFVSFPS